MARTILFCLATGLLLSYTTPARAQSGDARTLQLSSPSEEARNHLLTGMRAMQRLDFVDARANFDAAAGADPGFALARALRAPALPIAEAQEEIDRALVLARAASPAEQMIVYAMREWVDSRPAAFHMRAAAELVPDDALVRAAAVAFFGTGSRYRVDGARELVERDPTSAIAHAELFWALGAPDSAEARAAAEQAVRLAPEDPFMHATLAQQKILYGQHDEAVPHLERALELDPDYYDARRTLGFVALFKRDYAGARRHFERLHVDAVWPEHRAEAGRLLGLLDLYDGDAQRSLRTFDALAATAETVNRRQEAVLAHRHAATVAGVLKQEDRIRRHLEAQDRLGRIDDLDQYWRVIAWAQAGRADLAQRALDAAERQRDDHEVPYADATLQRLHGLLRTAEGRHEEALQLLEGDANHWAMLARYESLVALDRAEEAEQTLRELLTQPIYTPFSTGMPVARFKHGGAAAERITAKGTARVHPG